MKHDLPNPESAAPHAAPTHHLYVPNGVPKQRSAKENFTPGIRPGDKGIGRADVRLVFSGGHLHTAASHSTKRGADAIVIVERRKRAGRGPPDSARVRPSHHASTELRPARAKFGLRYRGGAFGRRAPIERLICHPWVYALCKLTIIADSYVFW